MNENRIHRAVSADGTEIAGRVHGQGPPLVFVPGGPSDGEKSWRFLLPFLSERFTCYCMSPRGKGLSAGPSEPDYARERLVQDVTAFVESIGEPVFLMGHSSGGTLSLEAAAHTEAVSALALYEPGLEQFAGADVMARFKDAIGRARRAAEEGKLVDAAQIFFEDLALANDEELPVVSEAGVFDLMAPNIPVLLQEIDQAGLPQLSAMALLERVTMPVLLLHGTRTHPFYNGIIHRLPERLTDAHVRELDGVGHLAPQLAPEPVAEELIRFFATASQPA